MKLIFSFRNRDAPRTLVGIHEFGSPDVIRIEDAPQPTPNEGEILVRVAAAGVGPWDALLREGKIPVSSPLPLIVGADLSGVVEATRPGLMKFNTGDEVYGLTNNQFVGAYAEYAVASETMVARKPTSLSFAEAASAPVVAVTAWQMLFDRFASDEGDGPVTFMAICDSLKFDPTYIRRGLRDW